MTQDYNHPPPGRATSRADGHVLAHDPPPPADLTIYAIVAWDDRYENNRSRGLKSLGYVPISNHLDDEGYRELIEVRDGEDPRCAGLRWAAWIVLVMIASRSRARGTLVREPRNAGGWHEGAGNRQVSAGTQHPATAATLRSFDAQTASRQSGLPVECFELCIARALEIGWLVRISLGALEDMAKAQAARFEGAGNRQDSAGKRPKKGSEGNGTNNPPDPPRGGRGRSRLSKEDRIKQRLSEVKL